MLFRVRRPAGGSGRAGEHPVSASCRGPAGARGGLLAARLLLLALVAMAAGLGAAPSRVDARSDRPGPGGDASPGTQTAQGATRQGAPAAATGSGTPTAPAAALTWAPGPGPYAVEVASYEWTDADRNRQVPARIYFPRRAPGKLPIIIVSHGLGGSRFGDEYLGRAFARHGYVSVHLQHPGSDVAVLLGKPNARQAIEESVRNPQSGLARVLDVVFAIDQLDAMATGDPLLKGRLDLKEVGVAGHNLGAWTALGAAGLGVRRGGHEGVMADPRVKAVVAISPPVPPKQTAQAIIYDHIQVPVLHLTGAADASIAGHAAAAERRFCFDHISGVDQLLVTFAGADQLVFFGHLPGAKPGEKDSRFQDSVKGVTTAFWDAYLKHDAAARTWLTRGGLTAWLQAEGSLELKLEGAAPSR